MPLSSWLAFFLASYFLKCVCVEVVGGGVESMMFRGYCLDKLTDCA